MAERREKSQKKEGLKKRKTEELSAMTAAAGVQLVRLHTDTQTETIWSLVGISAPVCVCVCVMFLGQVGP